MPEKITKKAIRTSNRTEERKLFRDVLSNKTLLQGLVLHSNGQGGTGKTTLLKMFEDECQQPDITVLYFTARRPLRWQTILDKTVVRLGSSYFAAYIQLRESYAGHNKEAGKAKETVIHQTVIQNIHGSVHTGSGDIKSVSTPTPVAEYPVAEHSTENLMSQEEARMSLTNVFLQELSDLPESSQLVWLVDTVERLDEDTENWLIDLFEQIAENEVNDLVLVAAGRDLLCYEPYWIDNSQFANFKTTFVNSGIKDL